MLQHVSALAVGYLPGALKFFSMHTLSFKLYGRNSIQDSNYDLPEDGRQLRPKHVGAIINK